jgi:hypothetical protein
LRFALCCCISPMMNFDPRYHCFAARTPDVVTPTIRSQQRVNNILDFAWKKNSKAAQTKAAKALGSARTEGQVRKFARALDKGLAKQLSAAQQKNVAKAIERTYKTAKALGAKEAGIKGVLSAADKARADKLAGSVGKWMDRFYGEHLSNHVESVAFDILKDPEVPAAKRAKLIRDAAKQELSLKGGKSDVGKLRPAPYGGNVGTYTDLTSDVASHQARVMGKVSAFSDAGLLRYELRAVLDDRTSPICRRLHGQVFTIVDANKQIDKMLDADSPEAAKRASPWLTEDQVKDAIGPARRGSKKASDGLRAAGASVLPPFHGFCRTVPVPV